MDRVAAKAENDPDTRALLQMLVGDVPDDAAALARAATALNAERLRGAWEEFAASALRTGEVIDRLPGVTSRQRLHQMRASGALVGVVSGRETLYPEWQLGPTGLRVDLKRILMALTAFTTDVVAFDRIMRLPRPELGGLSLDATLDGTDRGRAQAAWSVLDALGDPR